MSNRNTTSKFFDSFEDDGDDDYQRVNKDQRRRSNRRDRFNVERQLRDIENSLNGKEKVSSENS
jgi:hypothetical protein